LGKAWETERARDGPYIVGLACAVPGKTFAESDFFNWEERVLHRYHGCENAVFNMTVTDFACLPAHPHIRLCQSNTSQQAKPWSLRSPVSLAASPILGALAVGVVVAGMFLGTCVAVLGFFLHRGTPVCHPDHCCGGSHCAAHRSWFLAQCCVDVPVEIAGRHASTGLEGILASRRRPGTQT